MWLLKLFELEISTRRIADQVRLSYPTVLKAVTLLRAAIFTNDKDTDGLIQDELDIDDICFGNRHGEKKESIPDNKIPIVGILRKDGVIRVKAIKHGGDVEFRLLKTVNNNQIDSFVCDSRLEYYDYLMCWDYKSLKIVHGKPFSDGRNSMNGLESFIGYAKERLLKFHGISREKFFLYMKEMEFRYNHRHEDLFILFAQNLCALMPFKMPKP